MTENFYMRPIKWIAAYMACSTLIFSPVAMGREAETHNKKNIQQTIKELGLRNKVTLGEFWENSKAYMPGYIYKDLEAFVKENKNLQMPEVSFGVSKATDGKDIPVVTFSQNGKTQTVQFFGEQNKWAKFNGVVLSASDLNRVDSVFKRIEGSDIKLKTEADKYRNNKLLKQKNSLNQNDINLYKKDFARFDGFPRVTPQMWKSLTKEQRAGFLVKIHLLWIDAKKVLAMAPPKKQSIQKSKEAAAIDNLYKIIFGQDAAAAEGVKTPSAAVQVEGTSVRTKKGVVFIPYNAKSCVVAGYIGAYGKVNNIRGDNRDGCSIDVAVATYKSNPNLKFVQEANNQCGAKKPTLVACNPIVYGYPNGSPACIDRRSAEYQQATHFVSPGNRETCDGKSRLSSSDEIIKFNDKDYANIQPREKQIAAIEADQQKDDYALTLSYLKGVLTKKDPAMLAMLDGEWNITLDDELVRIQSQFEQEIARAIKTCENDISGSHEKNQKLACDQLHRRWLFTERTIAKLRDKACLKPALYVGKYAEGESSYADTAKVKTDINKKTIDAKGTDLCECPIKDPAAAKEKVKLVSFNESCEIAPVITDPQPPSCKASSDSTDCKSEPAPVKCSQPEGISGFDYEKCKCDDNKKLKQKNDGSYECEGTNWLPWILGGLGVLALIAIFHKDKKPNPPTPPTPVGCTNVCAGGAINPMTCECDSIPPEPSCVPPKIGMPPSCACPAAPSFCTLPQKIYDISTCQCTNIPQPPVCADASVAPNGNLAQCPTCPNGSFKTTAGCPTEGGTGNNTCANPPCSGGLPSTAF